MKKRFKKQAHTRRRYYGLGAYLSEFRLMLATQIARYASEQDVKNKRRELRTGRIKVGSWLKR